MFPAGASSHLLIYAASAAAVAVAAAAAVAVAVAADAAAVLFYADATRVLTSSCSETADEIYCLLSSTVRVPSHHRFCGYVLWCCMLHLM